MIHKVIAALTDPEGREIVPVSNRDVILGVGIALIAGVIAGLILQGVV